LGADWLLLLTDVDGFFRPEGPLGKPRLVRLIRRVTPAMEAACNAKSQLGRGGMRSKLRAALRATAAGIQVVIANGNHPQVIPLALQRRVGTYFAPLRTKGEKPA
jgi:glutamate 5-kinase